MVIASVRVDEDFEIFRDRLKLHTKRRDAVQEKVDCLQGVFSQFSFQHDAEVRWPPA